MKKIIITAASLLMINQAMGQKLSVTAGGGISFNSIPKESLALDNEQAVPNYTGTLRVAGSILNRFEIGVGADILKLSTKGTETDVKYEFADPALALYLFVNRRHGLLMNTFYYGISAGYMTALSDADADFAGKVFTYPKSSGFTGGLQLGYDLKLSKHIGLNAQAAARFAKVSYDMTITNINGTTEDENYDMTLLYFPLTLGIRYSL